jgi:hypothetical protein
MSKDRRAVLWCATKRHTKERKLCNVVPHKERWQAEAPFHQKEAVVQQEQVVHEVLLEGNKDSF